MNDITFSANLHSEMSDNKYDRFVKNRRTGKLNTTSLYKIRTSSRLFKRREARKNKHYAVSIVVDCSGSMSGEKIKMAAESARKISYHLGKMEIPHNIVTFNLTVQEAKPFSKKYDSEIENKVLSELGNGPLRHKHYKYVIWTTDESVKSVSGGGKLHKLVSVIEGEENYEKKCAELGMTYFSDRGGYYTNEGPGINSDAEALRYAKDLLLKQQGTKMMIFLSDGQPAPMMSDFESPINPGYSQRDFDVKKEVEKTLNAGVELYSIGMLSSEVNKFYPPRRTCSINSMDQLYPHIIKLIRLNLKRG